MLRALLLSQSRPAASPVRGLAFAPDGGVLIAYADGTLVRQTGEWRDPPASQREPDCIDAPVPGPSPARARRL